MRRYAHMVHQVLAVQWFKHGDHSAVEPCDFTTWDNSISPESPELSGFTWVDMGLCGESRQIVRPGDYIVSDRKGNIYPVSEDVFSNLYLPSEEPRKDYTTLLIDRWFYIMGLSWGLIFLGIYLRYGKICS